MCKVISFDTVVSRGFSQFFLAMANASHLVVAARRRGHSFHNLAALYSMLSLVLLGMGISPLAFDLADLAPPSWMILLLPKMALPRRLRSASPPSVPAVECFPGLHGRRLDGHLVEGGDTCIMQEPINLDVVLTLFARDGTSDVVKGDLGCTEREVKE
jgi:hypothetical protein